MRLFKQQRRGSFNWQYVLGEILLIFFGITLAVWFNNWNADRKMAWEKRVAVARIEEELQDNLEELQKAQQQNQPVVEALQAFFGDKDSLVVLPSRMKQLQQQYPNTFLVSDSTVQEDGKYGYTGELNFDLSFPDLTQIAWETTRTTGVAKEFDYECLYEIEKTYNFQRLLLKEVDAALEATRQEDVDKLARILNFSGQLYAQQEEAYQKTLTQINNCY